MGQLPKPVIPSMARDLDLAATYEVEIPRLRLGMTKWIRFLGPWSG